MSSDEWVANAIAGARKQQIEVPDAVWDLAATLLANTLSRRPMPAKELAGVAMRLIEATGSVAQYPGSLE